MVCKVFVTLQTILYNIYNNTTLKTNRLITLCALIVLGAASLQAQVITDPIFNRFKLEARADLEYHSVDRELTGSINSHPRGFNGRYFNLHVGGNLTPEVSYYFRQRIIAKEGTVSLFDNTDFLYVNYQPTEHWMFRLGKDAIAVGGFEYDAPPIDVLFSTVYWDNFYCFQLGGAAAYRSADGSHTLMLQVANSPYVHYNAFGDKELGKEWQRGLLAYSLFYSGTVGHLHMLYSTNLFERPDHGYMNYIAIGNKLVYDRWDIYLDLIHRAHGYSDWGNNFAIVSCFNFQLTPSFNLFAKGGYEQNRSDKSVDGMGIKGRFDCLVPEGESFTTYGLGFELRPTFCRDLRIHGYVASRHHTALDRPSDNSLFVNGGITWDMDIHAIVTQRMKQNQ